MVPNLDELALATARRIIERLPWTIDNSAKRLAMIQVAVRESLDVISKQRNKSTETYELKEGRVMYDTFNFDFTNIRYKLKDLAATLRLKTPEGALICEDAVDHIELLLERLGEYKPLEF